MCGMERLSWLDNLFFMKIQKEVARMFISILSSERDVFERIFEKFPKNS